MESLKDENVKIVNMNYQYSVAGIKNMKLNNICIYPVFTVIEKNVKKGAVLRFTRVENFKKMNAITSFINDMYKKRREPADAYNALVAQYGFDLTDAKKVVSKVLLDENIVSKNPGLITTMKLDEKVLRVNVNNVDNINYVETLAIYLDSIVKITQDMVDVSDLCNVVAVTEKEVEQEEKEEEEEDEEEEEEEEDEEENKKEEDFANYMSQFNKKEEKEVEEENGSDSSSFGVIESDAESDSESAGGDSSSSDSDIEDVKGKKYFLKRLKKSDTVLFKETSKKNGKIQRVF
jgi:Mg-chelatase subunit ChlI